MIVDEPRARKVSTLFEYVLLGLGLGCAFVFASVELRVYAAQHGRSTAVVTGAEKAGLQQTHASLNEKITGRLEIPKLELSVPIFSDFDPSSLRQGIGHVHGTANPGGLGNLVLVGHRDTFFRPLQRITKGMGILISDEKSVYQYSVERTEIVSPEEVRVLEIGDRPELTLVTCFPFDFVGAAPQRFIVHASLVSADPDHL